MTEIEQRLEQLQKENILCESFERLNINQDFQKFRGVVSGKLEALRLILEDAKDEDLANVRGQIKAVRGILEFFDETIQRHKHIISQMEELQKGD